MGIRPLVLALALGLGAPAQGSNYFLDQITAVASRGEIRRLRRAGVLTTDELARRGATGSGRTELARRTGIPLRRLEQLSALADLMRLRGVGPDAARLLLAAGCHGIGALQRADAQLLADAVKRINDRRRMSTNPPRAENLVAWIAQAQQLTPLYHPDS